LHPWKTYEAYLLVPVGHLARSKGTNADDGLPADEQRWDQIVARARAAILKTINARTGLALTQPLQDSIRHEIVNTPLTWEN
jgi:phytoene desaturase (3,4-didehydrolycopene-forming)